MSLWEPFSRPTLTPSQIQDLRLAASKMTGAARRAFQAEMTLKYCRGSARLAETILGWSRGAVGGGVGGGVGGHPHGHSLLGGTVCLQWAQTLGGARSGGGRGAATAGRSARAARPDFSHDARLCAPAGSGRWGSAAGARGPRGAAALTQHHGGSVKPDRLSLAQSYQSQAAEKDQGNRCHL